MLKQFNGLPGTIHLFLIQSDQLTITRKLTLEEVHDQGVLIYPTKVLIGKPNSQYVHCVSFYQRVEFSFNAACGYSLNNKWYFGLRFTHSVLPVRQGMVDISRRVCNRVLAVTFARHIPFKKEKPEGRIDVPGD